MKQGKNSFLILGIINITIHIPAMIVTSFWGLLIMGIFGLWEIDTPFEYMITMFPITIPLISCVMGTIRGAIYIKRDKYAKVCLLLSLLGIVLYVGMIVLCAWIGSIL